MSNVLKVKVAGQRVKYQVSKVTFDENDLLKANAWRWDDKKNSLYPSDNKLDIIRDYETFDCADIGIAIRTTGDIYYELGDAKGKIQNHKVLSALNHSILIAIDDANEREGLTFVGADVYDNENTIYEYIVEVSDGEKFDAALLETIIINDPITDEEYIVELRYNGKKMRGGAEGLSFNGEPVCKNSMLNLPNDYAIALGLGEHRKLDNLMRFDDFIKEEKQKCKSAKNYVKIREDYIHSFIDEHEPDHDLPEEE